MEILQRFLNYVSVPTNSNSKSKTNPSTINQRQLAELLVSELNELKVDNVYYDRQHCYVYAMLKGNVNAPKIGFISHLDTSEAVCGENIKPNIIKNYNGENITLSEDVILDTAVYPDLTNHKGKTLITTDGSTLLGADDKAGIAEIMNMLEYFCNNNEAHGDIYVCFTPDEEISRGTDNLDFSKFKADFAYTVDGSDLGEISYENFNAANVEINIKGVSSHTGYAKDVMVNSLRIANEINNLLPNEIPESTSNYEGFYHLSELNGDVSNTYMKYLIRDFDMKKFEDRKQLINSIVYDLNLKYNNCIDIEINDKYYNMKEIIDKNIHLIDNVKKAMNKLGITPIITPVRGGTDGADLSYKGLPCPNLGTGSHNFHGVYEYVTLEDMESASNILIELVREYANCNKNS